MDAAVTTMISHVRKVNKKELNELKEICEFPDLIDLRRKLHKDHEKRGELLLTDFNNLRVSIRRRFGDAKIDWKAKSQIAAEVLEDLIPEEKLEQEEIMLGSVMFRDVDPHS